MHLLSLPLIYILQTQKFCNLCLPKQPLQGSRNLLFLVSPIQNGRPTAVAVSRNTHSNTTMQRIMTYQNQSPLPDLHQTAELWTPQNLHHENSQQQHLQKIVPHSRTYYKPVMQQYLNVEKIGTHFIHLLVGSSRLRSLSAYTRFDAVKRITSNMQDTLSRNSRKYGRVLTKTV